MNKPTRLRMIGVAEHLEKNAEQELPLERLAKIACVSAHHLQKSFKDVFGISPKQFQNAVRMQRLKHSLRHGVRITDAICASGFGSPSRVYEQLDKNLGMTPGEYQAGAVDKHITFAARSTQIGTLMMAATERGVCFVQFGDSAHKLLLSLREEFPKASLSPVPETAEEELNRWAVALEHYLDQSAPPVELPVELYGTVFQQKVWRFLTQIPAGSTASYSEVARAIGHPKAHRAVANACGSNRIAVLIPCHRVLRGDGSIGGYRWGVERKQHLLALEQSE